MDKIQKYFIKSRILNLARLRATGTPAEMAYRFGTSCRTVKRIVNEIRAEGYPLVFDNCSSSYILKESVLAAKPEIDCIVSSYDD